MIIVPTPKQREARRIADRHKITLYGGAIRGGKSYWLCLMLLSLCFEYPRSRWLIVRESLPTMRRTILVTFQEFLNNGFHQYVTTYDQQMMTVTFNNGSQIIFMAESYDTDKELNRFRGLEINGAGIDEINEIQEATFNKIIERSGSWNGSPGCPVKILATCNPTNGWVKEKFYKPWKEKALPYGFAYVPAKITDNPHLSAEYLDSLKMLPRYQYEVFVNGNWDIQLKVGGEFYKCFELDKHVGKCDYDPALALHISWDENVNPYLPCGIFQLKGKDIYMIDEVAAVNPRNTIKDVCNEIKRKYPAHASGMFIYGDATSKKEDVKLEKGHDFFRLIMEYLKDYKPQLRVLSANPSVAMRGNFINTILEKQDTATPYAGITVTIDERCQNTINDFVLTKEAADGTKNKEMETDPITKVRSQKYGHFTDLFDYLICFAFRAEYEQYQRGDAPTKRNFGKNVSKNGY
ncbi:MAG: hypothetical protein EOP56_09350 [Sphingobacteriales bacterium]|nr:MAG: hypothetical protein EOP56_09350 [Sphingobacteriales bacterium]